MIIAIDLFFIWLKLTDEFKKFMDKIKFSCAYMKNLINYTIRTRKT